MRLITLHQSPILSVIYRFSRDLEKMASFLEAQPILVVATENRLDPSIKMQDPD